MIPGKWVINNRRTRTRNTKSTNIALLRVVKRAREVRKLSRLDCSARAHVWVTDVPGGLFPTSIERNRICIYLLLILLLLLFLTSPFNLLYVCQLLMTHTIIHALPQTRINTLAPIDKIHDPRNSTHRKI